MASDAVVSSFFAIWFYAFPSMDNSTIVFFSIWGCQIRQLHSYQEESRSLVLDILVCSVGMGLVVAVIERAHMNITIPITGCRISAEV